MKISMPAFFVFLECLLLCTVVVSFQYIPISKSFQVAHISKWKGGRNTDLNNAIAKIIELDDSSILSSSTSYLLPEIGEGSSKPSNTIINNGKEKCLLVCVDIKSNERKIRGLASVETNVKPVAFSTSESLKELSELVKTAGLEMRGVSVQRLQSPLSATYIGTGKISEIVHLVQKSGATTLVFDDDLSTKQQRNLEDLFASSLNAPSVKILDRTAIILEIFAQHAKSKEGQLQVELAMLEYRLTRGPRATGTDRDSGCGFRGPGETRLETDKRVIKDKILAVKKEIEKAQNQREQHRQGRTRLGIPLIALVGYTNAGKSTLMNRLSQAGVLAEDMLFATLDPTTRRVQLPRIKNQMVEVDGKETTRSKGLEVLLSDTVGFISKLPTSLIAAFRSTLEEVNQADILIHVVDRSNPIWKKQRDTVIRELNMLGSTTPVVELWNKIDVLGDEVAEEVRVEAMCLPVDTEGSVVEEEVEEHDEDELDNDSKSPLLYLERTGTEEALEVNESMPSIDYEEEDDDDNVYIKESVVDSDLSFSDEEEAAAIATKPSTTVATAQVSAPDRVKRSTFVVAASVKSGLGVDDFLATVQDTLNLLLVPIDVLIPYEQDKGFSASVHSQGIVENIEYREDGMYLSCKVPAQLYSKLEGFRVD